MLPIEEKLDPRVKRTRSLILRAFEELLAEKNFESISVQDVTDGAQINRATFYAHFQDKYALLDYAISQMFKQEIEKRLAERRELRAQIMSLSKQRADFIDAQRKKLGSKDGGFDSAVSSALKEQLKRKGLK